MSLFPLNSWLILGSNLSSGFFFFFAFFPFSGLIVVCFMPVSFRDKLEIWAESRPTVKYQGKISAPYSAAAEV